MKVVILILKNLALSKHIKLQLHKLYTSFGGGEGTPRNSW